MPAALKIALKFKIKRGKKKQLRFLAIRNVSIGGKKPQNSFATVPLQHFIAGNWENLCVLKFYASAVDLVRIEILDCAGHQSEEWGCSSNTVCLKELTPEIK
jgi:hypothetical protein